MRFIHLLPTLHTLVDSPPFSVMQERPGPAETATLLRVIRPGWASSSREETETRRWGNASLVPGRAQQTQHTGVSTPSGVKVWKPHRILTKLHVLVCVRIWCWSRFFPPRHMHITSLHVILRTLAPLHGGPSRSFLVRPRRQTFRNFLPLDHEIS